MAQPAPALVGQRRDQAQPLAGELRLRVLPPCMCSRRALEEALKSLGLLDAVESIEGVDFAA